MQTLILETLKIWFFTFFNIPLIFWLRPRVMQLNSKEAVVMIKLNRRSRNHVNSVYFGALCTGADLVAGALAMHLIKQQNEKIIFVFKDFNADFLHRCEDDVYFTCSEGSLIMDAINLAKSTGQRQNTTLNITATVPTKLGDEVAATFKLTISLKKK